MVVRSTQTDMVLQHMEMFGEITPSVALGEYGVQRLASRISDLKRRGIKINSVMRSGKNRLGGTIRYAVYTLAEA